MQHDLTIPAPRYTYDVSIQGFQPDVLTLEVDGGSHAHQTGQATLRVHVQSEGGVHSGLTEAKVEIVASRSMILQSTFQMPPQHVGGHIKKGAQHGSSVVWAVGSMAPGQQPYVFGVQFKPTSVGVHRIVGVVTAHELDGPVIVHLDLPVTQPGEAGSGSSQP